jgi:hypothetical protein
LQGVEFAEAEHAVAWLVGGVGRPVAAHDWHVRIIS